MDEKEAQKKYLEYQFLHERIQLMQQQLQNVEQQLGDSVITKKSLEEFSELNDNDEILIPINNGIFAKAKLVKENELLVNVGASVVVDKSVKDTISLIEKQQNEIEGLRNQIAQTINAFVERAAQIERELNEIITQE
jgi:prefoldin alpha subunit